jgi:hypothetical protein
MTKRRQNPSPASTDSVTSLTDYRNSNATASRGSTSGRVRKSVSLGKRASAPKRSGTPSPEVSTPSVRQCSKITNWGRCCQPALISSSLCHSHELWSKKADTLKGPFKPDPFYERKIVLGLLQPTFSYMTETEAFAVVNGRYRGDGRRIDQYVSDDPLDIDLENL